MRELVARYLSRSISRRTFVNRLVQSGVSLASASSVASGLTPVARGETDLTPDKIRIFEGTGGEAFAEQLIASGVRYVFGNSASDDAHFYEALVDRPQLTYVLTPHEGPGAAMAMGYIQASGEPAIAMETGIVGLPNAIGQMYNAWKEQTPLVFYSYGVDRSDTAGRDGFQEVFYQEEIVAPLTKWRWLARRAEMIPETIRRSFKVAWTPPFGPTYSTWHSDFTGQKVRSEIIVQEKVNPRMQVRPNPREVERAAALLVEARRPLLVVGDELYKTRSIARAVELAELLGMPVTQMTQVFSNFPETHPLWVGGRGLRTQRPDLVLNLGNKLQGRGPSPLIPRDVRFIDMRIDSASMGSVLTVDVPLVADVGLGLEDLLAALRDRLTPALKERFRQRSEEVEAFSRRASRLLETMSRNPQWNDAPMVSDRVSYEVARFADPDAIIVNEVSAGGIHAFRFDPLGGREHFRRFGGHLGGGVGRAAGVKLARRDRQVICLVGDGAFVFGPTGMWNMARLGLPVTVVVYNNHAYGGPHNRVIAAVPDSRMVKTGRFFCDYLGKPDMNMVLISRGFGVDGEVAESPDQLRAALGRARRANDSGRPYLIDAQVARTGPGWSKDPWVPELPQA